jgi:hypothetical protein
MRPPCLIAALLLVGVAAVACDPTSEDAFTVGKSLMPCLQNIPACAGLFATCELNSTTYAQQRFPDDSPFRFLVAALPREKIEVVMFFVGQSDVGLDTRILWYEPGCSDVYTYKSDGENLFAEAEETGAISRKETVFEGGDHLVEIFSDMQALVDITVNVTVPASY